MEVGVENDTENKNTQEILDWVNSSLSQLTEQQEIITEVVLLVNTNTQATSFIYKQIEGRTFLWMLEAAKYDLVRQFNSIASPATFDIVPK